MRDVRIVIEFDSSVVVPIVSPVVPAPTVAGEKADSEAQSKTDSWTFEEKPGVRIPSGKDGQRRAVHQPRIIFRHIDYVRSRRLNDDRLSLGTYFLLGRSLQIPGLLRPLSHGLDRLGQFLLLVEVRIAEF